MPMDLRLGDIVRLKKAHPCGSFSWEITRLGADIGLRCQGCGRRVLLARSKVEKRIRAVERAAGERRLVDGETTGN
jgi:hypothetical protein